MRHARAALIAIVSFAGSLGLALAVQPPVSRADILVVAHDSLIALGSTGAAQKSLAPMWDLAGRSTAPNVHITQSNADGWTLAELRDSVSASATNPKYRYGLIVMLQADRNAVVLNSGKAGRIAMSQLTKSANRPKTPVLYVNVSDDASFQSGGNESLGVVGAQISALTTGQFANSPAGYQFPTSSVLWKRDATGAYPAMGSYVTPVLWLAMYTYTKADPNGVGGDNSHPGTPSDSLIAWFYNPPNNTTYTDRTTTGFGAIQFGSTATNSGGAQYPEGSLATVAVGMMKRLAPEQFAFPGARAAVEIDDGCKRLTTAGVSAPQVVDAIAGIDSMGAQPVNCKIPFTYGIETDSMTTAESGSTRFAIEFAAVRRYGMGKVTVHNHKGVSNADSSETASVASGLYPDIFGAFAARRGFAVTDKSIYSLLRGATAKLVAAAGGPQYVSFSVMPPTDNYKTVLAGTSGGNAADYDSIAYAIALAGYRVVRTQYLGTSYNYQQGGGGGGLPRGFAYPLPDARTLAASITNTSYGTPRRLIFAPSGYIYGTTTDTTTAADAGAMKVNMNTRISRAFGYNRPIDMTTAQEAASSSSLAFHGTTREAIWVTHLANWRQGIGVSGGVFSGTRPAWDSVRMVHGAMMAAKWAACASGNCAGPVEWHYADEVTERDVR